MAQTKLIGSKWVQEILKLLMDNETLRFSEIMSSLDITDKVLSEKMRELQKYKIVTRTVREDRSTIYSLTEKGKKLSGKLAELNEILESQ